jgi:hypothetical protein
MKVLGDQFSVVSHSDESKKYGFEKLIVWQKAMDFCTDVYKVTKDFPKEELFGLTSQMRRQLTRFH